MLGFAEGSAEKTALHAAVGCAAATIGSSECMAGAIGSGLAELIGKPLAEAIPDPARQTALLSLIAGAAGAIAGGSADALNAAASQAATTHQNNYLNHAELEACMAAADPCSAEKITAILQKDAAFAAISQANTSNLMQVCLVAPASQACAARVADLKGSAARLEQERDNGQALADPTNSATAFSVKQSIFDYDLLLARSLSNSTQPADLAIRDFVVELSKTEGKINAFLSAAGVVGGVGVCASGAGTMACAAGALGALASGNHLYGDAQQAITGNEARTALVQALTAQGLNPADAQKYQAYVDAGAVVVTLGIVGGQAVYRFTVNSTRVSAADRAALEVLGAPNKNQMIDDLMRGGTKNHAAECCRYTSASRWSNCLA